MNIFVNVIVLKVLFFYLKMWIFRKIQQEYSLREYFKKLDMLSGEASLLIVIKKTCKVFLQVLELQSQG